MIIDIVEEVGLSTKMVRKNLNRTIEKNLENDTLLIRLLLEIITQR